MEGFLIGVDVGTGSVRAGLFSITSVKMIVKVEENIQMWKGCTNGYNWALQSSNDVWNAVCACIRKLGPYIGNDGSVLGISFDATCSLCAFDGEGSPVGVGMDNDDTHNIIVWMDHRAVKEAEDINQTKAEELRYVGGVVSAEMQLPKILWMKRNLPANYKRTEHFIDLADWLCAKSCGLLDIRSTCSIACKWTAYDSRERRWSQEFLARLRLGELKVGKHILDPGTQCGKLTEETARAFGLDACGASVAMGIIDAHAGAIGVLVQGGEATETLALIGGTSTCHMFSSRDAVFVEGVWGPYYNVMIPGLWLLEGGSSSSGSLLAHLVSSHVAGAEVARLAKADGLTIFEWLNQRVHKLDPSVTANLHVGPDFLGNRSPLGDPNRKGMVIGRTLQDESIDALALLYLAALQSLCYTTRDIMEAVRLPIRRINACGGLAHNELWCQTHADVTGVPVFVAPDDAVLLGAALLAGVGAGIWPSVQSVHGLSVSCKEFTPRAEWRSYHDKKFAVFKMMQADQLKYKKIME